MHQKATYAGIKTDILANGTEQRAQKQSPTFTVKQSSRGGGGGERHTNTRWGKRVSSIKAAGRTGMHKQNNGTGPSSYTTHTNQLPMAQRLEPKT